MPAPSASRLPTGALVAIVMAGCAAAPAVVKPPEERTKIVKAGTAQLKDGNLGRVLGTIVADAAVLEWAGVASLAGAEAQAFDQDGKPLGQKVTVDADGHFMMTGLLDSRGRIYIEADVNGLRYRTLAPAPRERKDYGVMLDAATTFLADKMHRSALDQEVFIEKLDEAKVDEAEDLVNLYLDDEDRREVLEQDERDLNAFAFDHFMDDHQAVKIAVYALSPSVLRGWRPNQPQLSAPTPRPTPKPTPTPTPTPDPNATATPFPVPSGNAPK